MPKQQVFVCSSKTTSIDGQPFVYIEAERWFDARELAYSIYGPNDFWIENVTKAPSGHRTAVDIHKGNWWLLTWTGNAANNSLERVVWRYGKDGKRRVWADSSSVMRTGAIAAGG